MAHIFRVSGGAHGLPSDELPVAGIGALVEASYSRSASRAVRATLPQLYSTPLSFSDAEAYAYNIGWGMVPSYLRDEPTQVTGSLDKKAALHASMKGLVPIEQLRPNVKNTLYYSGRMAAIKVAEISARTGRTVIELHTGAAHNVTPENFDRNDHLH